MFNVFQILYVLLAYKCDTGAQNLKNVVFDFYSNIFYITSKYFLENQNILFLTEVILVWLEH